MNTKILLVCSLVFLKTGTIDSQENDSTQNNQNQQQMLDQVAISPFKLKEDKTSVYLNFGGLSYLDALHRSYLVPSIGIEQKLFKYYSVGFNLSYKFSLYHNETGIKMPYKLYGRFYYNLKERIMDGKTGNNFSANYIQLGYSIDPYKETDGYSSYDFGKKLWKNTETTKWFFNREFEILFGWRRQIHQYWYYDIAVGAIDFSRAFSFYGQGSPVFRVSFGFNL